VKRWSALQCVAASILVVVALPAAAAGAEAQPGTATRRTPFTHFGANAVMPLRGDGATATIDFGSRADELVKRATFHFRYAWSPALAPELSQIRLSLNDDVIGVLPVGAESAGKIVVRDIDVDPRLVVGFNRLTLSPLTRPGGAPADPSRPGLWAEVSGTSEFEVAVQTLAVADDLAILPEPFFDRRDQRRVTIPFVFAARPSVATLRAAGVVASWFGLQARWRGTRFPTYLDTPAPGHAVAFAANGERPSFLAALPPATGPQLRIMTNPADDRSKLLLVLGRDGDDLKAAADALALGAAALSGPEARVKPVQDKGPRAAYDAPRLVRLDRAIKLGELIDWPGQLQASGRAPALEPIRVDLRVPPDLATWRGPGVPLTLKLQYTPPPCTADSYLDLGVNDELLQVVPLRSTGAAMTETRELFIPPYRLRGRDQLAFAFRFVAKDDANCRDPQAGAAKAAVSADSTLDFTGFPHYARLPNLAYFAAVGFPFTRFADLSQTVVVLPEKPAAGDVEAMLALLGRLGEASGYPATRVRIATPRDEAQLADADLLLIGASPQQVLLDKWADALPLAVPGQTRRASRSASRVAALYDWLGFGASRDTSAAGAVSFEGTGPLACLYGFESPLTPGRSVVAVTALAPDQMLRVLDALDNSDMRRAVRGSAAFVLQDKVESVIAGPTYSLGFLPPWTGAEYWLSEHPVAVGGLAAIALLAVGAAAWRVGIAMAARRGRRQA
jgi:hypothetical protein